MVNLENILEKPVQTLPGMHSGFPIDPVTGFCVRRLGLIEIIYIFFSPNNVSNKPQWLTWVVEQPRSRKLGLITIKEKEILRQWPLPFLGNAFLCWDLTTACWHRPAFPLLLLSSAVNPGVSVSLPPLPPFSEMGTRHLTFPFYLTLPFLCSLVTRMVLASFLDIGNHYLSHI